MRRQRRMQQGPFKAAAPFADLSGATNGHAATRARHDGRPSDRTSYAPREARAPAGTPTIFYLLGRSEFARHQGFGQSPKRLYGARRRPACGGAPKERKKMPPNMGGIFEASQINQRLLNWGARRAAFRPYFLRSFIRGSRVRKPAAFRAARYSGLTCSRARAMP